MAWIIFSNIYHNDPVGSTSERDVVALDEELDYTIMTR